jgi:uncharacterized protein
MLAQNVVHFCRVLRRAGLPVGPDRALAAVAAVEAVGLFHKGDVRAALSAVLLERHEQQPIFDAAFDTFWRDPKLLEQLMYALLPKIQGRGDKQLPPRPNRLAEALSPTRPPPAAPKRPEAPERQEDFDLQFAISASDRERLHRADFETMTAAEFAWAQRLARQLPPPVQPVRLRRREAAVRGSIDLRATLRQSARHPWTLQPQWRRPRTGLPPIVVLLDVSGSMERYSRLMLHYLHGLTQRHVRVQTFTFGTRLTNITRCLRHQDPDEAIAQASARVADWKGGTRLTACLHAFNHDWARRVLSGRAALLLVSDGLDRDEGGDLSRAAAYLGRAAHQFIWLNPLLRFEGFEPKAAGIRAVLPHVDRFLPVHNLQSLQDLERVLREPARRRASTTLS